MVRVHHGVPKKDTNSKRQVGVKQYLERLRLVMIKKRKRRPQPPKWFDYDTDNCYKCKNRNGCGGCKFLKRYVKNK